MTLTVVSSVAPSVGVLIGRMEDGAPEDLADFDAWYIGAFPRLAAALYLVGGDWGLAEDAANEACMRAVTHWHSQRKTNLDGWSFVVGRNYIRRQAWRKKLEGQRSRTAAAAASAQNNENESEIERLDVVQLLRNLPTRQRDIVVLHYLLDLPQEEVARRLRISRSTVASTVRELREKLSPHLDEQ